MKTTFQNWNEKLLVIGFLNYFQMMILKMILKLSVDMKNSTNLPKFSGLLHSEGK